MGQRMLPVNKGKTQAGIVLVDVLKFLAPRQPARAHHHQMFAARGAVGLKLGLGGEGDSDVGRSRARRPAHRLVSNVAEYPVFDGTSQIVREDKLPFDLFLVTPERRGSEQSLSGILEKV